MSEAIPPYNGPNTIHPSSARFYELLDEARHTHNLKQRDYGTDDDPFANVRAGEAFGIPAWVGCMIRANDKMRRIMAFARKGELSNESLRDSLMDLAVYSLIGIVLLEQEQKQPGGLP